MLWLQRLPGKSMRRGVRPTKFLGRMHCKRFNWWAWWHWSFKAILLCAWPGKSSLVVLIFSLCVWMAYWWCYFCHVMPSTNDIFVLAMLELQRLLRSSMQLPLLSVPSVVYGPGYVQMYSVRVSECSHHSLSMAWNGLLVMGRARFMHVAKDDSYMTLLVTLRDRVCQ